MTSRTIETNKSGPRKGRRLRTDLDRLCRLFEGGLEDDARTFMKKHTLRLENDDVRCLLRAATKGGHYKMFSFLRKEGYRVDINAVLDENSKATALILACNVEGREDIRVELIQQLVADGADILAKDAEGNTAWHLAVRLTHYDALLCLSEEQRVRVLEEPGKDKDRLLHVACRIKIDAARLAMIKFLLKWDADICAKNGAGETPVHLSAQCKLALTHFIDKCPDKFRLAVNIEDMEGNTPLHLVCKQLNLGPLQRLLMYGAEVLHRNAMGRTFVHNACLHSKSFEFLNCLGGFLITEALTLRDVNGETPLHLAALKNQKQTLELLLEKMGRSRETINHMKRNFLHIAASAGCLDNVEVLLARKRKELERKDPSKSIGDYLNSLDIDGNTPLHLACMNGHVDVVHFLILQGADPCIRNHSGLTPVSSAASKGEFMLDAFQDNHLLFAAKDSDSNGCHLLHHVAAKGLADMASRLLNLAVDPDVIDNNGWTPAHFAAFGGKVDVIKCFPPEHLNYADAEGETPLHLAATYGNLDVIRVLLEKGGEITAVNQNGRTAAHHAVLSGNPAVLHALRSSLAIGDNNMDTPLHLACWMGEVKMVRELVSLGASADIQNKSNEIPLHLAVQHPDVLRVLFGMDSEAANASNGHNTDRMSNQDQQTLLCVSKKMLNMADSEGRTPLIRACQMLGATTPGDFRNAFDGIEILLKQGADPKRNDNYGYSALGYLKSRWARAQDILERALNRQANSALAEDGNELVKVYEELEEKFTRLAGVVAPVPLEPLYSLASRWLRVRANGALDDGAMVNSAILKVCYAQVQESLPQNSSSVQYRCPLSKRLLEDPVLLNDMTVCDRGSLEAYLRKELVCEDPPAVVRGLDHSSKLRPFPAKRAEVLQWFCNSADSLDFSPAVSQLSTTISLASSAQANCTESSDLSQSARTRPAYSAAYNSLGPSATGFRRNLGFSSYQGDLCPPSPRENSVRVPTQNNIVNSGIAAKDYELNVLRELLQAVRDHNDTRVCEALDKKFNPNLYDPVTLECLLSVAVKEHPSFVNKLIQSYNASYPLVAELDSCLRSRVDRITDVELIE